MPHKPKRVLLEGVTGVLRSKVIGCNTLEIEYENGNKAIRYHNTDVITMLPNGNTVLTSGGWRTYTTKERLNRKYRVWSEKGIWYIKEPATGNTLEFFDGITFDGSGKLVGEAKTIDHVRIKAVKKKIAAYIKLVDDLIQIPIPDDGDCWNCRFNFGNGSCLESHLEEKYIHGSVIYRALEEKGYRDPALIMRMGVKQSIKDALRRYFTKRLLPEVQAK